MNMKKILIALLLMASSLCGMAQLTESQQPSPLKIETLLPDFNKLTPEAASLGQYGAYGISEYSGVPNINIPLLNIKSGDLSFPIQLYYDASGIKVDQEATFVGLGWNLNYGGCISHIVCGNDDFTESANNPQSYFDKTFQVPNTSVPFFSQYVAYMGSLSHNGETTPCLPPNEPEKYLLYNDISKGFYTPDIFQANFCGHNISFIIDKNTNEAIVINDITRKYKIEYTLGNIYPSSFTITDDKGISYQFDAFRESANEDMYYLRYIYGMDGKNGRSCIEYCYTQYYMNYGTHSTKTYTTDAKITDGNYYPMEISKQMSDIIGKQVRYTNALNSPDGNLHKVYPTKIITKQDTVYFVLTNREDMDGAKSISEIYVKSRTNTLVDKINLSYSYFIESPSSKSGKVGKRLKLTNITNNDKKYSFKYNESVTLPAYDSYSQDFWGYYNGVSNEKEMCASPKYSLEGNVVKNNEYLGDANRFASETHSKAGVLTGITYPTGGHTDFEYELNHFTDKYYYPEVSTNFKVQKEEYAAKAYGMTGMNIQSKTFVLKEEKECSFCISLYTPDIQKYVATVSLKNANTGKVIKSYSTSDTSVGKEFGTTVKLSLPADTYVIEAKVPNVDGSVFPVAECEISHLIKTVSLSDIEKGGMSVGGGLRIKSIKNYESANDEFLNGEIYEYKGGKLLMPTAQLETHFIDYTYKSNADHDINLTMKFVSSHPAYSYICSLGTPASVGYSTVTKKEIGKNENIIRKTILDFYNSSYEMDENISQRINNAFYYNQKGYMNGKINNKSIYGADDKLQYSASFSYDKKELGHALFPKCIPTHLPSNFLTIGKFDLAILRKPIVWSYLTTMQETSYEGGKVGIIRTNSYSYNTNNFQIATQNTTNKGDGKTVTYKYWYPTDAKSAGTSYLLAKHCYSQQTGSEIYINGKLSGGSKVDYALNNGIPVVSKCYSILPDGTSVTEATINEYDEHGNILQFTEKNGVSTALLWSYDYQYPVLKLVGLTYQQAKNVSSDIASLGNRISLPKRILQSIHASFLNKSCLAVAYLYDTRFNLATTIDPNGYERNYEYDSYGRLSKVLSPIGTLQEYEYNYRK